jgi:hypothetical protein
MVSQSEGVRWAAPLVVLAFVVHGADKVRADEGGVSFWVPGQYASLTAVPGTPGWSIAAFYYHAHASSDAREQFPQNGQIRLGLDAKADEVFLAPTYTFPGELFSGQVAVSLAGYEGRMHAGVDAILDGPNGN